MNEDRQVTFRTVHVLADLTSDLLLYDELWTVRERKETQEKSEAASSGVGNKGKNGVSADTVAKNDSSLHAT
jgi:hypothetical protein